MRKLFYVFVLLVATTTNAHEMVPTYPKWEPSLYNDVLRTRMEIFNKRSDVEYYEIGVFDRDWKPVPFVTSYKVIQLKYLGTASVEVFIKKRDRDRVEYICSRSKLKKGKEAVTVISSRICSRFKE
jgi:hypothetical protein